MNDGLAKRSGATEPIGLPDGQFPHAPHAQIARRANLPQAIALAPSGKSQRLSRASRLGKRGVSRSSRHARWAAVDADSVARERDRRAALAVSD
jgi:hypothetical protein